MVQKRKKASLLSSKKGVSKRTDSPAKIDQTLEIIGGLLDILLSADTDETPPPDITTELSAICQSHNIKPSICEIALNQPVANPGLLRLHHQARVTYFKNLLGKYINQRRLTPNFSY